MVSDLCQNAVFHRLWLIFAPGHLPHLEMEDANTRSPSCKTLCMVSLIPKRLFCTKRTHELNEQRPARPVGVTRSD
jgi:hypothetical protein